MIDENTAINIAAEETSLVKHIMESLVISGEVPTWLEPSSAFVSAQEFPAIPKKTYWLPLVAM